MKFKILRVNKLDKAKQHIRLYYNTQQDEFIKDEKEKPPLVSEGAV